MPANPVIRKATIAPDLGKAVAGSAFRGLVRRTGA